MKAFASLIIVLLIALSSAATVPALALPQGGENAVTYDAPVEGIIQEGALTQTWIFVPRTADRITIQVERLTGNLMPDVSIMDASGQMLQSSYGPDYTKAAAIIENFTLPVVSQYQIVVGRYNGESGSTFGTYRLTVTPVALAEDNPNNTVVAGPVVYDTPVTGEITPVHWRDLHILTADEGDVIQVHIQRTSGTLYPEVEIVDANGSVITTGYVERSGR